MAVVVAVIVVAAVVFGIDRRSSTRARAAKAPPSSTASTASVAPPNLSPYKVFYADPEGSRVVPLDGTNPAVVLSGGGYPDRPLNVVGGVAFIHARSAYFLPDSVAAGLRMLGAADHLVPALGSGELVGLVSGTSPIVVQFVNILGAPSPTPPSVQLPPGYQPIAQVDTGVLVVGSNREIRVWLTKTRTIGPLIGTTNFGVVTYGDNVAWLSDTGCNPDAECPLHVTNTRNGADQVVGPPPGHGGFWAGGAFSPDGRLLAAFVSAPSGRGPQAQLVVADVGASIDVLIDDSVVPVGEPIGSAVWSPDGAVVFFGGIDGPMHASETGGTRATPLRIPSSYSFSVF